MADNRAQAIFGGFGAGSRAGLESRRLDMVERQKQIETNKTHVDEINRQIAAVTKAQSDAMFSPDATPEQKKQAEIDLRKMRGPLFQSLQIFTNKAIETGFMTPQEAQIALQAAEIAGNPINPANAQNIEAQGKATVAGQVAGAESGAKQDDAIERIRETAAGQARVRATPTSSTQNINTQDANDLRMNDSVSARAALKNADRVNRQLRKAQNAFDSWRQAKGSGGITGAVGENIGGLIGQIPLMGEGLENGLNLILTGGTTEENTRARTNAITLAADMLSEITGEESGRFTEAERELAFRALRQLSPSASTSQIAEAYRTFIEASVNEKSRSQAKMKLPSRFNTDEAGNLSVEGRTDYVIHLMRRGFTEQQAIGALKRRIRDEELEGVE